MAITATPEYNQYYLTHRDEIIRRSKNYYEGNKGRILMKQREHYVEDAEGILAGNKISYLKNREKILNHKSEWQKQYSGQMRTEVMVSLGNKCASCGVSDLRVLQIDHINGNGREEIRRLGNLGRNSARYYKHILENIVDYQLLCANCNWIKEMETRKLQSRYYKNNNGGV